MEEAPPEPPPPPAAPTGATAPCALHPGQPAIGTCERCGNYLCEQCSGAGLHAMCPACRQRLGLVDFPLSRDRWTVEELLAYTWRAFKREWVLLTLAMLLVMVVSFAMGIVFGIAQVVAQSLGVPAAEAVVTGVNQVVQLVVQGWLQLGLFAMMLDALGGMPVRLGTLFGQYRKIGKVAVQGLVAILALAVPLAPIGAGLFVWIRGMQGPPPVWVIATLVAGGLVLLVAIAYVSLGVMFMQIELAHDDSVGPFEAIARSWELARGRRWGMLGVSLLGGLIAISGVLACCVGLLATIPLAQLLLVGLFLTLRRGANVPAPVRYDRP